MNIGKNETLFFSATGSVTRQSLREALLKVGAADGETLFVHSSMALGEPNPKLKRSEILQIFVDELASLGVPNLVMPTFTFSFCNGEDFDVDTSRTKMGALNEFFRRLPDVKRSPDPLMSVALLGRDNDLVDGLGAESIGANSNYDRLYERKDVRFLFLGVDLGDCFTYMHHLEWRAKVPYRYDRTFRGAVFHRGKRFETYSTLFVRYQGVEPNSRSHDYGSILFKEKLLKKAIVGNSEISCVDLTSATTVYLELLEREPNFFIRAPFDPSRMSKKFEAHNMLAL